MRVARLARSLVIFGPPILLGCAQNPLAKSQQQALVQQQQTLAKKAEELQSRAGTLDQDNQELQALLAQSRQQNKLVEDQLAAVREQLAGAASQLTQLRDDKQQTEKQAESILASTRRKVGATITANSSLRKSLPAVNIPGVEVRPDGDVVRVELPAAKLFQPGSVTLQPAAVPLVDSVAAELSRAFPGQMIGIEGHTDADGSVPAANTQQLSVGRAMSLYQQLTTRSGIKPGQLFVVGHGGNHPVVSNATPVGKQRNNRVELVVYPEKAKGA